MHSILLILFVFCGPRTHATPPACRDELVTRARPLVEKYAWDRLFPAWEEIVTSELVEAHVEGAPDAYRALVGPRGGRGRWVLVFDPRGRVTWPFDVRHYGALSLGRSGRVFTRDGRWYLDDGAAAE